MDVDRAVADAADVLKILHIGTDLFPGDLGNGSATAFRLGPFKELGEIADIGRDGAFRQIAEGKDIALFFNKGFVFRIHRVPP